MGQVLAERGWVGRGKLSASLISHNTRVQILVVGSMSGQPSGHGPSFVLLLATHLGSNRQASAKHTLLLTNKGKYWTRQLIQSSLSSHCDCVETHRFANKGNAFVKIKICCFNVCFIQQENCYKTMTRTLNSRLLETRLS